MKDYKSIANKIDLRENFTMFCSSKMYCYHCPMTKQKLVDVEMCDQPCEIVYDLLKIIKEEIL